MWKITANIVEPMRDGKPTTLATSRDFKQTTALIYPFRLLDDDGEVYFEGVCDDNDSEKAFEPLDDYGQDFGCTEIQYKRGGIWETL